VVTSIRPYAQLDEMSQTVVNEAKKSGMFMYVDSDLKYDRPLLDISVNRSKAASLGIDMNTVNSMLTNVTGGPLVNYFSKDGYSFQVIEQVPDNLRAFQQQLDQVYLPTSTQGQQVPLSSIVSMTLTTEPEEINQFNQLNSFTISAIPGFGVTQGQALAYFNNLAKTKLPSDVQVNYANQSRQYVQEGDSLVVAFFLALIVIFLVLSAQFESFRDPIIILVAVPMSICGALIPLYLGAATMNIYTEIGLITLIGLISKHGILMVEFANKLQEHEGLGIKEAIIKSASIRLRPILMTTAAMVFGVVPLILASGAGAVSRFDVGLVIATGMLVGTCFTLFVVPTIYTFLAADRMAELKHKAEVQIMPPEEEGNK
jgi:multidrug efflux pump